jgi:short-subunit dehydrogenase
MKTTTAYTLITGASMGLGKEMAIECARRGRNLILVALPASGLQELCSELRGTYRVRIFSYDCDMTDETALGNLGRWVKENFSVDQLINNAGIGGTRKFEDVSEEYLDRIIHLNIRATTMMTCMMLPLLKRHDKALIMNVSSLAAFGPLPFKTIYPASKAFIYSFSRGLSRELKGTGVRVVVVAPGPFISNADVASRIGKQGILARLGVLTTGEISRQAFSGADHGHEVIVPGIWNKFNRNLMRWVPEKFRLSLMASVFKRELS